ncbi:MAG: TMEM175 family protein [Candidatus Andersenbacteria bacterium]|nr:TMEM175 family protein [Candidatus Andersenbacteria bacterium]
MNTQHDDTSSHNELTPARLEAFSDAVMAIIITITVLELHIPEAHTFTALQPLIPLGIAYVISFHTIGTYWNNHHHLLRATKHISAGIMWANLNLLFWLSLIPFTTGWLGRNYAQHAPTVVYAAVLLCCAVSYALLQSQVVKHASKREKLEQELRSSRKGIVSVVSYALAVVTGFYWPILSDAFIVLVLVLWFIPDRRIEKHL